MIEPEDTRWLRTALQEEARRHIPDREAMLRRIEARRARRPGARIALQLAVAAAAVTAVVVPVTVLVASSADRPAATVSAPGPGGGETAPGTTTTAPLLLIASGRVNPHSNPWWSQNDLTLNFNRPVTRLEVTVRIKRTKGVRYAGGWRTLPETHFDHTHRVEDGALVYRWILRPGRVAWAGRHVFGIQYHHAEGRRSGEHDRYTITAVTEDGVSATVSGHFGG